jgi:hypothetical protein
MNPIVRKESRVGGWLFAGLLFVIVPSTASAQAGPAEGSSNIACLEHLEVPDYPPLPRTARIQVIQTVRVFLSDQATAQTLESSLQGKAANTEKYFTESADKALKNSRFSRTCGGKTITLVFHYEIREDYAKSLFAFGPPNHFWIRYGPVYINPKTSGK